MLSAVFESGLPPNLRIVLLAFADNASDDGYGWSSVPTVAAKSGYSERQTIRLMQQLCEAGMMRRVPEAEWPSEVWVIPAKHRPVVYQIEGCQIVTPKRGGGVTDPASRGDTTGNPGVTPMSPNPIRNPKKPCSHLFQETEKTDVRGVYCVRCKNWISEEETG